MAIAEIKDEVTAANVRKINRTEKTITTTIIKRIITIIILVGDTIIEGVILSIAENQARTEIIVVAAIEISMITDAGIYFLKTWVICVIIRHKYLKLKIFYFRTDRYLDEDWRTGRKISTCESDDGRQTPKVSSHTVSLSSANSNSTTHRSSPTGYSNAQPGVLILPNETNQSSPNQTATTSQQRPGQQQQRTLFDPNNPYKPIVITSPGSRAAVQR